MNQLVFIENNRVLTDSLTVAETFEKRHADVLRDIKNLGASEEFNQRNFALVDYKDRKGETRPKYLITQDGFTLLVMGYTGKKAMQFKEAYINEFRKMEAELRSQKKLPTTFAEALRLAADLEEEKQKLLPKAEYFDALVDRNLLTNFRDTAKELKIKPKEFTDWLLEHKYIYRDSKGKPKPYAEYVPSLFELKEFKKGNYADTQTLVTPKGRETFRLLIKERVSV